MTDLRRSGHVLARRAFVGTLAAGGGLLLAGPAAAVVAPGSGVRQIAFDIHRDGATIGRHEVGIRRNGARTEVDIAIDITVRLAFIPVFSYRHRNHEVWQDDRLVALDSETDDDGERLAVTARRLPEGLRVVGAEGSFLAPPDILPTSYWDARTVQQTRLLDSQHGRLLNVQPAFVGADLLSGGVPARRYRLTGDLDLDLWYSGAGEWLKIAFQARGAEVTYARREPGLDSGASG